jgi:hypothetical protein
MTMFNLLEEQKAAHSASRDQLAAAHADFSAVGPDRCAVEGSKNVLAEMRTALISEQEAVAKARAAAAEATKTLEQVKAAATKAGWVAQQAVDRAEGEIDGLTAVASEERAAKDTAVAKLEESRGLVWQSSTRVEAAEGELGEVRLMVEQAKSAAANWLRQLELELGRHAKTQAAAAAAAEAAAAREAAHLQEVVAAVAPEIAGRQAAEAQAGELRAALGAELQRAWERDSSSAAVALVNLQAELEAFKREAMAKVSSALVLEKEHRSARERAEGATAVWAAAAALEAIGQATEEAENEELRDFVGRLGDMATAQGDNLVTEQAELAAEQATHAATTKAGQAATAELESQLAMQTARMMQERAVAEAEMEVLIREHDTAIADAKGAVAAAEEMEADGLERAKAGDGEAVAGIAAERDAALAAASRAEEQRNESIASYAEQLAQLRTLHAGEMESFIVEAEEKLRLADDLLSAAVAAAPPPPALEPEPEPESRERTLSVAELCSRLEEEQRRMLAAAGELEQTGKALASVLRGEGETPVAAALAAAEQREEDNRALAESRLEAAVRLLAAVAAGGVKTVSLRAAGVQTDDCGRVDVAVVRAAAEKLAVEVGACAAARADTIEVAKREKLEKLAEETRRAVSPLTPFALLQMAPCD